MRGCRCCNRGPILRRRLLISTSRVRRFAARSGLLRHEARMTRRWVVIGVMVLAAACNRGEAAAPPGGEAAAGLTLGPDDVAVAKATDVAAGVVITGTLEPSEIVDVKAQVA